MIKDAIFNRCKAYNPCMVVQFMTEVISPYFENQIMNVVLGKKKRMYLKKSRTFLSKIFLPYHRQCSKLKVVASQALFMTLILKQVLASAFVAHVETFASTSRAFLYMSTFVLISSAKALHKKSIGWHVSLFEWKMHLKIFSLRNCA